MASNAAIQRLFLYDDEVARGWLPFSPTRPAGELLYGTRTLRARAESLWGVRCEGHLAGERLVGFEESGAPPCLSPGAVGRDGAKLFLCGRFVCADVSLPALESPTVLLAGGGADARGGSVAADARPVGAAVPDGVAPPAGLLEGDWSGWPEWRRWPSATVRGELLDSPWTLMRGNADRISADAESLAAARAPAGAVVVGDGPLCLGEGAVVEAGAVIDTTEGAVVLDGGARVAAPCRVGGPAYLGADSTLLGGTLTASSIGPRCKVRGEIESTVFLGYANKAHDGFVGHAVIGRWANLGALTTNSDLKNTYGPVRSRAGGRRIETGLTKAGCLLGDHVRTGIGTLLDTGAVVGAGSSVFGGGMAPKETPPFSWCGPAHAEDYDIDRFIETASRAMARRGVRARRRHAEALQACVRRDGAAPSRLGAPLTEIRPDLFPRPTLMRP